MFNIVLKHLDFDTTITSDIDSQITLPRLPENFSDNRIINIWGRRYLFSLSASHQLHQSLPVRQIAQNMTSHDDEKDASAAKPRLSLNPSVEESLVEKDDLAAAIVSTHAQAFDQATERRVLRKIDTYLMPWMWLGYGFVYYDKVR